MTRVGVIDCGTNSCRLLVAETGADGRLSELTRELEIVRLGQGVDATGELHPDALARTFAAAERYADRLASFRVASDHVRVVATSAVRDATNPEVFFAGMAARLGVRPVVIPGVEEARLSFVGALSGVTVENAPVLVMDIGGGSTELVIGGLDGTIWGAASLDAGSVRLTERFGLTGPTPSERRDAATAYVDRLLDGLDGLDGFDGALAAVGSWIGVAGTVTTLSAIRQGLGSYDRDRVHGSVVEAEQLSTLVDQLAALSVSEIRALGPVEAGRADVITAGALIAERFGRRVGGIMVVSETDLLDGVALELLRS